MNTIGDRLRALRNEKGLSAKAFGKIMNVSDVTIIYWENNQRGVANEYLIKLAQFFDVSTDYLLGLEDEFGAKIQGGL